MKKSLLLVALILVVIATLPVIGNSFMKKMIDMRLVELKSHGLTTKSDIFTSNYLYSSRHFEFAVKDTPKFINYLNTFSDKQIPPYVNAILKGAVVGMDVKYNNLPFAKGLLVDIYPLTLSDEIAKGIKDEDLAFYNYVDKFLTLKGVLYHINYDITSKDFDGYIKDIKESYTLKDGTDLKIVVNKALFKGNGYLIAPDRLSATIKEINIGIHNQTTNLKFGLKELKSSSTFESVSTYLSSIDLKNLELTFQTKDENILFASVDTKINLSANTQGEKAEYNTKSSIKELKLSSSKGKIAIKDFKYDIAVNGIDKLSLERLRVLASLTKSNHQVNAEIIKAGLDVISHGLEIDIPELSVKNIAVNKDANLKGFSIKSTLKIKEDKKLASKVNISSILLVDDVDLHLNIKLSNEIYNKIMQGLPLSNTISSYANVDDTDTVFDILFSDGNLKINGKDLK